MKITLRLILSLVAIVAVVAFSFSFWQARQEEARLKNELERRANIVADSLKMSVEPLLLTEDKKYLQRIVDKFSNRERLVGIAIYDIQENLIVSSADLQLKLQENPKVIAPSIQDVERLNTEQGQFVSFGKQQLHAYSLPLSTNEKVTHVLIIFHDATALRNLSIKQKK